MKSLPFTKAEVEALAVKYPTPFYIYDEAGIRAQVKRMREVFAWNAGFKEYYAVKALPNPVILQIVKDEGCGLDCSSMAELVLADKIGVKGENIMFSSNDTPAEEFRAAKKTGAIINLDDIAHLDYLEKEAGLPDLICIRYTPARGGNDIIGKAHEAKFGVTREQLFEGYALAKAKGVTRFGLHTMPISNELNVPYFIEAANNVFIIASEIEKELGISFEFINLGGGIGIPYKPGEKDFDLMALSEGIRKEYEHIFGGRRDLKIFLECGRYITGPFGTLVTRVRHIKESYKKYVGVDACMADLMRPGMYGAYHHITVLGKENDTGAITCDVVGALCENNDKFAIDRQLPELVRGDILAIHDAGAHGHTMGFNYNGRLRPAEFLMRPDKSFRMIRRAETLDDHFATLKF